MSRTLILASISVLGAVAVAVEEPTSLALPAVTRSTIARPESQESLLRLPATKATLATSIGHLPGPATTKYDEVIHTIRTSKAAENGIAQVPVASSSSSRKAAENGIAHVPYASNTSLPQVPNRSLMEFHSVNVSFYKETQAHVINYTNSSPDMRWASSLDKMIDDLDRSMEAREAAAGSAQRLGGPTKRRREAKKGEHPVMVADNQIDQLSEALFDENDYGVPEGERTIITELMVKFGKHNLEAFAIGMAMLCIMVIGINACWADVERLSLRIPSRK